MGAFIASSDFLIGPVLHLNCILQDDFLDCYGDEAVIGKIGTDIQDNKCSWLVITAIDRASPDQLQTLKVRELKN